MSAARGKQKWIYRLWATWTLLLPIAGCSMGGGSSVAAPGGSTAAGTGASLRVALIVGAPSAAQEQRRHALFISPKSKGVKIMLAGTATYTATFDLSAGSASCAGSMASPRTCTGNLTGIAADTYAVTAVTYDQAPALGSGIIPAAANLIARGSVTGVGVRLGAANVTSMIVGGVVANFGNTAFISVPNDGSSHQIGFALAPNDAAGEAIVAGVTINDTYANPVSLTLTESGSGSTPHETLVENGVNVGTNATITKSTDRVQVDYDGGGSAGYFGSVAIAAAGVTTATVSISPMFVIPSDFATGRTVTFAANTDKSTFATTEANAPNTVGYTVAATPDCSGVASASNLSGTGASFSVLVTAGSVRSSGGCTITIADNLGTGTGVTYAIVNSTVTYTPSSSLPSTARISNLAPGPDGKLWAVDTHDNLIYTLTLAGAATALSRPTATFTPRYIVSGPDGNMWVSDQDQTGSGNHSKIECITTTGASCGIFPVPSGALPAGIVTGSDGNLWFAATSPNSIDRITPQGVITQFGAVAIGAPDATAGPQLALGGDGNVWFTELSNSIGRVTPSGVVTEFSQGIRTGARTYGLTRSPDGSLWFTEFSGWQIGHITFDGSGTPTISEVAYQSADHPATTVSKPWDITVGGDGNIWFVQSKSTGRLTPAGILTVARTTTLGNIGMTTAADGSVWLGDGQVGIIPLGGAGGPYVTKVNF